MRWGILLLRWLSNRIPNWAEKLKVWIRSLEAVLILLKDLLRAIDSSQVLPIELEVNPELHEAIEILLWTISLNDVHLGLEGYIFRDDCLVYSNESLNGDLILFEPLVIQTGLSAWPLIRVCGEHQS